MAGHGPAPKPEEARRRRNKPPAMDELPASGFQGEFPSLPASYRAKVSTEDGPMTRNVPFLKATKEWYETWGRSPMAVEFTGVHWQRLQRIARLVDQFERNPSKELAAEIRLQEAGFGGTPMDLRRLGKKIAAPEPPAERPLAQVRRLRAVDADAVART